jgi:drug/metabolite transporter (DMT)-like permease
MGITSGRRSGNEPGSKGFFGLRALRLTPAGGAAAHGIARAVSQARPLPVPSSTAIRSARAAPAEDRLRGVLLVVGATITFSLSDTTAKYVTQTLPAIEVTWVRYVVFVLLAASLAARRRRPFRTARPALQVGRGVAIVVSAILFILGLGRLPIADAAAINFVSPVFITLLAVPMLGERVEPRRWIAIAACLGGALLAAHPGAGALDPAAAFPFLSAVAWAVGIIFTRRMAGTERPATTLLWTAVTGLGLLTCLLPVEARLPSWTELLLCLQIGVLATTGQWLVVLGYRLAPASLLAPFSYLQLVWSTTLGIIVFGAAPALDTVIGAAVIVASGLYLANRERGRS